MLEQPKRDNRRPTLIESFRRDLIFAVRLLRKNPSFTAIAVITLALGIGANTAIFSVVNAILLRPLPFKDPQRIVNIWETNAKLGIERGIVSPADFADWREQTTVFENISAWRTWFYRLSGTDEPEQVWGVRTSANFFQLLGVEPSIGRAFHSEEEQPGRDQVVILSHGLWERRFGADPSLVGKTITIDDRPFEVIGILPRDFSLFGGTRAYDIWMPYDFEHARVRRDDYSLIVFGRLKANLGIEQARAEMNAITTNLEQLYPATNRDRRARVITLQENQTSGIKPALMILLAAVGFVLLIACANVANLLLARASSRKKEIAVRIALGASRGRLIRQLLTESTLLALLGGIVGLLIAGWGLAVLRNFLPMGIDELPRVDWIVIDKNVLGFSTAISLLTGIAFGLIPAIQSCKQDVNDVLKDAQKSSGSGTRRRSFRDWLAVSEMALATVLLLAAGLMIRSLGKLVAAEPGFDPQDVLTMQIWLPDSRYSDRGRIASFYQQALERIRAIPTVKFASAIDFLPFSGWGDSTSVLLEGQKETGRQSATAQYRVIDRDYFRAMRVQLLRGREFGEQDRNETDGVALINETMARRFWPDANPIGKRIRPDFPESTTPWRPKFTSSWLTIVGVIKDVKEFGAIDETPAVFYLPYLQSPSALMRLVVRGDGPPANLSAAIRQEVLKIDKDQPVTEIKTMENMVSEAVLRRRFNTALLGIFATLALALSVVGIYGVMSYTVLQRRREIGIRMALGADNQDVLVLTVAHGIRLSLKGIVIGLAGGLALTRVMASLLFGVGVTDPATYICVALVLLTTSLMACYLPARRATRVSPVEALRYE